MFYGINYWFIPLGNDYSENSASGGSQYSIVINEDDSETGNLLPVQENGGKYIEVIPVHDDDNDLVPSSSSSSPSANIPLQRIVQSVKHTKRRGSKVIKEGWLVHFTNKDRVVCLSI